MHAHLTGVFNNYTALIEQRLKTAASWILYTAFHALTMPNIRHALCAWGGFLTQIQKGMLNAFLRRMYNTILSVIVLILMLLWMTWRGNVLKCHCLSDPGEMQG